ncbi:unnamed protein product [Parnassius apollo]|uniref:(apollo) hypothetical protein n=1 Tax=Parnassius apollo TaxID=110799 RepID=A0A8S3XH49_PARAO|nr:unnamed protein product [Parnassius apollo]
MAQRGTRIGPLPGGRRGASGAGAGRDSMRAASRAQGATRSPSSPPHPSSPPEGLVSAGSSRTQQAAPAAGATKAMNENALRAYYRAKGEETVGIAYRARMHCFFAELELSIPVTEHNLADRDRYIMRSKYLMMPNSSDYNVRLLPHPMNRLWLGMRLHRRQTSIHTWKTPWIFQL